MAFLDMVTSNAETPWTANIQVFGVEIAFKIDPGMDVTAITEESYHLIGERRVTVPDKPLCGPSGDPLEVRGWFAGKLSHGMGQLNSMSM